MEFKNITNVKLFARGKRGVIYTGVYDCKEVAIKTARADSKALGNIEREADWLKKLNKEGIGPNLLLKRSGYFVYQFVEGVMLPEYVRVSFIDDVKRVLCNVLEQCHTLDLLQVNKQEMHRPYKHIIVGTEVVMIDFERCKTSLKPQNVTQFVQYICTGIYDALNAKGIKINKKRLSLLANKYKENYAQNIFEDIINEIQ